MSKRVAGPVVPQTFLTQDYLRRILRYDPATGEWAWIVRRKRLVPGSRAGTIDKDGYRIIKIDQRLYRAARLAFFYMTSRWPRGEVDHRDLDKANDKWINLREATKSQNMQNTRSRRDNKTGIKRVYFRQNRKKFIAEIQRNGRRIWLGSFSNAEDAHAAYARAARDFDAEFARDT